MESISDLSLSRSETAVRHFMVMVYGWMCVGLAVTGATSAYMASDPRMIVNLAHNPILFYGIMIAQFALVVSLSGWVMRMEAATAKFIFVFYSALTGVTLSTLFLIYTSESLASTFFLTAGVFGIMSAYGYVTKTDLTKLGSFCFMALIGVILASVVNWWLKNPALAAVMTYLGLLIFIGLTAYDTQKIKAMARPENIGSELETKGSILGALTLYLDFLNLFLMMIRMVGRRRD